jgi:hypothetical protein
VNQNDATTPERKEIDLMSEREMLSELVVFARAMEDAIAEVMSNPMLSAMLPKGR